MKRTCSIDGEEVPYDQIAKGYESPDGRLVAFVADLRGNVDLVITDLVTMTSTNLTSSVPGSKSESPTWSRDGRRLLYGSTREDPNRLRMDVFVTNADGSGLQNLTRHPHEDFDARWSGDDSRVIFSSLRTGSGQLYELDTRSLQVRALTSSAGHNMDHAPKPTGRTALAAQGNHCVALNQGEKK